MTVVELPTQELLEWVEKNLFESTVYDEYSPSRLATAASEVLGIEISPGDVGHCLVTIREAKNHNMEMYPFNDEPDFFNNPKKEA